MKSDEEHASGRPARRDRASRPPLSAERIALCAIALADEEGLETLSIAAWPTGSASRRCRSTTTCRPRPRCCKRCPTGWVMRCPCLRRGSGASRCSRRPTPGATWPGSTRGRSLCWPPAPRPERPCSTARRSSSASFRRRGSRRPPAPAPCRRSSARSTAFCWPPALRRSFAICPNPRSTTIGSTRVAPCWAISRSRRGSSPATRPSSFT